MVESFWVTTVTGSLYSVYLDNNKPVIQKTDQLCGTTSHVPIGTIIPDGSHVAITKNRGVMKYIPEISRGNRCSAWATNTTYHGGGTSPIVGLFLEEEDARKGYGGVTTLAWDWRYQLKSLETLQAIGIDHPYFVVDEPVWEMVSSITPIPVSR